MRMIRKFDNFFLGTGEGDMTDRLWFYGTYVTCITMVSIILL